MCASCRDVPRERRSESHRDRAPDAAAGEHEAKGASSRERASEGERSRPRRTDRKIDGSADHPTDRPKDRQTDRQTERPSSRERPSAAARDSRSESTNPKT